MINVTKHGQYKTGNLRKEGGKMKKMNDDQSLALVVGRTIGVDFKKVDPGQFSRGIKVELEHGSRDPETNVTNNDLFLTGKIAWAHLKELPDYYTRLEKMESDIEQARKV